MAPPTLSSKQHLPLSPYNADSTMQTHNIYNNVYMYIYVRDS